MYDISMIYMIFANNFIEKKLTENNSDFALRITTKIPHLLDLIEIQELVNNFVNSNNIDLFIKIDNYSGGVFDLRDIDNEVDSINDTISDFLDDNETDIFSFELRVKKKVDKRITIYSLSDFINFIHSQSLDKIFELFSDIIRKEQYFFLAFDNNNIMTDRIVFTHNITDPQLPKAVNRKSIVERNLEVTNLSGINTHGLVPSDFFLIERSMNSKLNSLFDQTCLILCFFYLSNIIKREENIISYRIIGYKPITGEIPETGFEVNGKTLKTYYDIVTWVYEKGSISDKCGLARNILSLYVTNNNFNNLQEDLFSYVLSCNELYLRENINKYIEVKGNVVNLLNDLNVKYVEAVDSFSSKIKNNLVAILSFYFSTLVLNTIATGEISNIFTKDIAMISYVFFSGSFLYLMISLYDYWKKAKRYEAFYNRQKRLYSDILVEGDIDELFLYDQPFKDDKKEIMWSGLRHTTLWVVVSLVILYAIGRLSGYPLIK